MPRKVVEQLEKLLAGQPMDRTDLIWFLLFAGLLFATAHLITMFVTRWGDSQISVKSLGLSLLMHLTCGLGLVSMEPVPAPPATATAEDDEDFVEIREILTPSEDQFQLAQAGETPFWEQPKQAVQRDRVDQRNQAEWNTEPAVRTAAEANSPTLPDQATIQLDQNVLPDVEQSDALPDRTGIDTDPVLDQFELDRDLNVPNVQRNRLDVSRSGTSRDDVDQAIRSGTTDRVTEDFDPTRKLQSPDLTQNPESSIARPIGETADSYVLRESPVESNFPVEEVGAEVEAGGAGRRVRTGSLERFNMRRSLRPGRTSETGEQVARRSPRADRTKTLDPLPNGGLASRIGSGLGGADQRIIPLEMPEAMPRRKGEVAPSYQLRDLAKRRETARRFGGTERSEQAVEDSLKWLANAQSPNGNWDADQFDAGLVRIDENEVDREYAGRESDTGLTALATLAFLGAGYTHEVGKYSDNVERALLWLINQQAADGNLFGRANHFAQMYCHGMATYALAEAYGMQDDPNTFPELRAATEKAISFIIRMQNPKDGGWRYGPDQAGDMSMFGWQLMAPKSAEIAGIPIPAQVKARLATFLNVRSLGRNQGLASYRAGEQVSLPMTAEALFCKQMMGIRRADPASREAVQYMLRSLPVRTDYNLYYWYYGTLAMYQYGGAEWTQWNGTTRDLIISLQTTQGPNAGSWEPRSRWGPYGGRIYTTAVSTLCLEVYYRLLPLYRFADSDR